MKPQPEVTHTPTFAEHTAMPMELDGANIRDKYHRLVAQVCCKGDAAFIVRCVNSHEELLAALKDVLHDGLKIYDGGQEHKADIQKAREVLARAEGE